MSQDRSNPTGNSPGPSAQKSFAATHYGRLGLHPSASVRDIRQTYRELSKLYHPDTTELTALVATEKFQQLNEAYAILSSPERRSAYDQKIGYIRVTVGQPLPSLTRSPPNSEHLKSSAYLDATDRPLSAGEIFALFILGITFVGCLILAITVGFTKGEAALQPIATQTMSNPAPTATPVAPLDPTERDIFPSPEKSLRHKALRMEDRQATAIKPDRPESESKDAELALGHPANQATPTTAPLKQLITPSTIVQPANADALTTESPTLSKSNPSP